MIDVLEVLQPQVTSLSFSEDVNVSHIEIKSKNTTIKFTDCPSFPISFHTAPSSVTFESECTLELIPENGVVSFTHTTAILYVSERVTLKNGALSCNVSNENAQPDEPFHEMKVAQGENWLFFIDSLVSVESEEIIGGGLCQGWRFLPHAQGMLSQRNRRNAFSATGPSTRFFQTACV